MKITRTSFTQGLVWNYISIFFLAVGGMVFSFLIGFYYDAETLGNFNLAYAYYIVLSQVGALGSHMAVTRYVAEDPEDKKSVNTILSCGILAVVVVSIALGIFIYLLYSFVLKDYLGEGLSDSVYSIILAIFFFAINKVILGYLNGLSKMKEYAVFQSIRNIFIAMWIVIFAVLRLPGGKITFCFAGAEIMIFLLEVPLLFLKEKFRACISFEWIKKIIAFGIHIMPANIVLELSTKVDILCLSWILRNERIVGIYSFAALFGEGFYQLFVVIRRSINPHITQSHRKDELEQYCVVIVKKIKHIGYLLGIVCMVFIVLGYGILCYLIGDASYYRGIGPLVIIMAAIVCNMKSIVFGNILAQTGYPAAESVNNIITVMANFLLNILFINQWGMVGAALATGISYFVFSLNQRVMVKRYLDLH